jgi:hypothetical protein
LGDVRIEGFSSNSKGMKIVYVSHGEFTAVFSVLVGMTPKSITINRMPKNDGVRTGGKINLDGLEATVVFSDDTSQKFEGDNLTAKGFNSSIEGRQTVTVGFGDVTASFEVFVSRTAKANLNGYRVVHTSWAEQGVDPRIHMGYVLEDGTLFFDNVVQLYGLRFAERDCADRDDSPQHCNKRGIHWCVMQMIWERMYRDYDITVKPVRDRGIKYLIGIVPEGLAVGQMYRWPMGVDPRYDWKAMTGEDYPYGRETVDKLLDDLVEIYNAGPFDGVGYDEEYASGIRTGNVGGENKTLSGYPETTVYPGVPTAAAWTRGGENLLRFGHELNEKILGPGKRLIQETYEIRYGANVPRTYTYTDDRTWGSTPGQQVTLEREKIIDHSYYAFYGGWQQDSANPGFPRGKYGPCSVDAGFDEKSPLPPPARANGSGIIPRMESHLRGNYGVVMYYCLTSKQYLTNRQKAGKMPWNYFGADGDPAETYLSDIGRYLHGQPVYYVGEDYNY